MKRFWLLALLLSGCASSPPLQLAKSVDLDRYYGKWYIVAEIPYFGERGNVGGTAVYTPLPNGQIDDKYYGRAGNFDGKVESNDLEDYVLPGTNNALWRVKLFWPIYVSYPILDVAPDYSYSLVGYPDRSLGWIFSRTPEMDDATYQSLLAKFAAQGYDTSQFRRVPQTPEQIGKPGFS
jgi:apolipoprotein D and lipocalin family protein